MAALRLNIALLAASIGCTFLPLLRFDFYEGYVTLNAHDLLFGRVATFTYGNHHSQTLDLAPNMFMTVAVAALVAAFILSLFPGVPNSVASSILAACGAISLYQLHEHLMDGVHRYEWAGIPDYRPAFYVLLSLLSLSAIAVLAELPFGALFTAVKSIRFRFSFGRDRRVALTPDNPI